MVTRYKCESAYGVIGTPKDKLTLQKLFDNAHSRYQRQHKNCEDSVMSAYRVLKDNKFDLGNSQCQSAALVFNLEPDDIDEFEDIYKDKLYEFSSELENKMSALRVARDFLKVNHIDCMNGIKCADSYKVLGMPQGGTKQDVNKIYRKLSFQYHPDQGGSKEKYDAISAAKKILLDQDGLCTNIPNIQDFMPGESENQISGEF